MFSPLAQILLLVILMSKWIHAQHSSAICSNKSLHFSFNSLGQSPCLVTAYLAGACQPDGDFGVTPADFGQYFPPDPPDKCLCSTVTFSLANACAACQIGGVLTLWSVWTENCTAQMISPDGEYPLPIRSGTAVPAWAHQLVIGSNEFNVSLARSVGDLPEQTPVPSSSSTQPTQSSSSSSASLPAQSTNATSSNLGGGRSNHVGAIAGGVVGGVVGIALICGLLAFFFIRSNRNHYQEKTFETSGTVAYSLNDGGSPEDRPMTNHSETTLPNLGVSIVNPSPPSSGIGFPVPLITGRHGNQKNYLSGHQPQPSLQGTSISENPHNPNMKLGSANEPDRLAVY